MNIEPKEIKAGDTISFSYGIPPIHVRAKVVDIDGTLWVLTPGHNPDKCRLDLLPEYVGAIYE